MNKIVTFNQIESSEKERILEQIKDIFYLSSSVKNFQSEEHRKQFFEKWCGDYLTHYSDTFYLLFNTDSSEKKLYGYLSLCLDSKAALEKMKVPGQSVFENLFERFPAHLHINFHPISRGQGLGSDLVEFVCRELVHLNKRCNGIHLVTSPDARNVSFYQKLGFTYQEIRNLNGSELLFMGKILI